MGSDAAHAPVPRERRVPGRGRGVRGARPGGCGARPRRSHARGLPGAGGADIVADAAGSVPVAVVNRQRGLGVYEVFPRDQLPFHFLWRMLGEGTYVVGIEPCTNRVAGRLDARERGELVELAPGERRCYDLELGALDGDEAIEAFAARVAVALAVTGPTPDREG
ncbi:MAG: DUF4432 family protein [Gaiellales bacterium]